MSCMASLYVKFQTSTWTLMSLNNNWNIKFAVAEYPPFSLLIFSSHILHNSCMAICILYPGRHITGFIRLSLAFLCWGSKRLSFPTFTEDSRGVYVTPPSWPLAKHTWQGWWDPLWLPLPICLQNNNLSLPPECFCLNQINLSIWAPHLAFTVPGRRSNASLCNSFSQNVVGWTSRHLRDTTLLLFLDLFQDSLVSLQQSRQLFDLFGLSFNSLSLLKM